jgi:hypothetical protein
MDELVAWRAERDSCGEPLDGRHAYLLHFDCCREPPAHGFWSLAMYDQRDRPVDNRLHRFSIGDRNALAFDADGTLDIVVCHESFARVAARNWLPAPAGLFRLTLNIYWPLVEAINGVWVPPPIRRIGTFQDTGVLTGTSADNGGDTNDRPASDA